MGPFEILKKVGEVAYRSVLPPTLSRVHNIFHVSQVKQYIHDLSHILEVETLQVPKNLSYEEYWVRFVDRKEQVLRRKIIPYVKLQWSNHTPREATGSCKKR